MKISTAKGIKGKATTLHSQVTRMYGCCENCGGDHYLQTAHINSRRFSSTRTLLINAYCLCAACHRHFTDHPREFSKFITGTWHQDMYDFVYRLARDSKSLKTDWQASVDFLKGIKLEIEKGNLTVDDARRSEYKLVFES